jgi:formate dehydrogenase subunit gamma
MTEMRTSAAPTASEPAGTVPRFGPTERAVHWVHAAAFFALLATGVALYLPVLAGMVGNRPLLKALHLGTAGLWLTALLALAVAGDRRRLRRTRQELERFTDDDLAWLRRRPARSGRFNAGQKIHAVLQAALAALFVITGVLLWLGERDTTLRFAGTIPVHDACTFLAMALVAGHLYLALVHEPTCQRSLRSRAPCGLGAGGHQGLEPYASCPPRRTAHRARRPGRDPGARRRRAARRWVTAQAEASAARNDAPEVKHIGSGAGSHLCNPTTMERPGRSPASSLSRSSPRAS